MSFKERLGINRQEYPVWQRDIEYAYIFLTQDQERLLTVESGSFEEEGLALRISKRVGNFTQAIHCSYKKALSEPRFGFPDFIEISRNENIIVYYDTTENEVKEEEVTKGRFFKSNDSSKTQAIPAENWGKNQIYVATIKKGLVSLLKHSLQEKLS